MPIGNAPQVANLFLHMNWSLFRADSLFFVTCDNPIFRSIDSKTVHRIYGDHGLLNRTAQITFPLSPKRLLMMTWQPGLPIEFPLDAKWVRRARTCSVRPPQIV